MGTTGRIAALAAALVLGAADARADDGEAPALNEAARDLDFYLGNKRVSGDRVEEDLSPAVRAALNDWAAVVDEFDLDLRVSEDAEAVLIGGCDKKWLKEAEEWIEEADELFAEADLFDGRRPARALIAFFWDRDGYRSDAWPGTLDALVEKNVLANQAFADGQKANPGGFTIRSQGVFCQNIDDLAGEGEFQLENETVNKWAQCMLTSCYGELPGQIRWGLGFVAEQRLFQSVYQFDVRGIVDTAKHFGWPSRTREYLEGQMDNERFELSRIALDAANAGRPEPEQMMVWAALDYLLHEEGDGLRAMLEGLAALHAKVDPNLARTSFAGDLDAADAILVEHLDPLEIEDLRKHLKRVK